jgi:hypothetical protein
VRIGEKIWHSKRKDIKNAEIAEFEKPVGYVTRANYLTCMPMTARGGIQMLQYGETAENYWTIIANARYFNGVFNEGDKMWVDGHKPIESIEEEYGYGASANAIVKNVAQVNLSLSILIERNQEQVKQ